MKMKTMFLKRSILLGVMGVSLVTHSYGQEMRAEVFSFLNLDYPGLEKVKKLHQEGKVLDASKALLDYYKSRNTVKNPEIDLNNIQCSKEDMQRANDGLEHTFFVHAGYQPSFNYGKDINWQYWPVVDNELRWQLHRQKWFVPMGKAYRTTNDEKYAKEWVYQYMDWIRKNPYVKIEKDEYEIINNSKLKDAAENARYAWRPLEVSDRLQAQLLQFMLFMPSPSFTSEFLTEFLYNYHTHAIHLLNNYSKLGNHLLFEAQRMICAGTFFPEFKEAAAWRKSGIDILNREIKIQVYEDGGQFELDPHYHLATIDIFCKALRMADLNGFRNEFPQSYIDTIEHMIMFYANICFPNYTNPCFSDAKITDMKQGKNSYKEWCKLFPENEQILYFSTYGKKGKLPQNLSKGFLKTGFFAFRNSWNEDATMMIVKAGPQGEWHCQPDNGTFEFWFNGKNLFPDTGYYVYEGDEEVMKLRKWFRQTAVHNTLTLDNKNLETTESVTKLWKPEGDTQILVTENPSYKGLKHRRSVFFVDNTYFVIVDEAVGEAKGEVNLHFQLCEGEVKVDSDKMMLTSAFEGDSNVKLQCFTPEGTQLKKEEGWRSTTYRKRVERTAVAFNVNKDTAKPVRYITVIYPAKNSNIMPELSARFENKSFDEHALKLTVFVGGKKRDLKYQL